jgi:subtilisin family serine protease
MNKVSIINSLLSIMVFYSLNTFAIDDFVDDVASEKFNYVVKFDDKGLLYYTGGINNINSTSPQMNEDKKFNPRSSEVQAYSAYLNTIKLEREIDIKRAIGNSYRTVYHYKAMYHGLMLNISESQAVLIRGLSGVISVEKEPVYTLDTERGPKWINADQIWNGSGVPANGFANKGEGIVVGVIDTGINTDHPSFAATGPVDGYVHVNPLGSGNFVGHCVGGNNDGIPAPNAEVTCNDKLIGAWAFTQASDTDAPEDNQGHGSHTAGTSAGNFWNGPFFDGAAQSTVNLTQISGVAPHANIIAYDICESNTCSASSAGIDRAIQDGVDVINFSISGGNFPWQDNDRQFLDAVNAGIFVAASAGNTGTGNSNPIADVAHKGPWLMSVAASTHDRNGNRELSNFSGGGSITPSFDGQSGTEGYGPAPIVYAGDFVNPGEAEPEQCLVPFPAGTWTNGEIVVCDRGSIARVLKSANVLAGGASGFVLANVVAGSENADFHGLPAIHIDVAKANELRAWLASGTGHMAEIINSNRGAGTVGDILAGFSLRGPNLTFDVTKPNITGPGVSIFAPYTNDPNTPIGAAELGNISGTSMSSPHLAGVGALMKVAQPTWSVAEINSAIQMTADETGRKENNSTPVDPDDVGNGRVDLAFAAKAGLVMDETFANYLAANPGTGGDPKTLNLPNARNSTCGVSCDWNRTLRSTLGIETNWVLTTVTDGSFDLDVTPSCFKLDEEIVLPNLDIIFADSYEDEEVPNPCALISLSNQTINFTATNVPTTAEGMSFGKVILTEIDGLSPPLHINVSVNQALPYGGTPPPD